MRDDDFRNALEQADVLLIGTPTIQRDAPPHVWHALSFVITSYSIHYTKLYEWKIPVFIMERRAGCQLYMENQIYAAR